MNGIIDHFEGDMAVVELQGKIMKNIYLTVLPYGVQEGDVIVFTGGKWWLDQEETAKRKAEIEQLAEDLFE